MFWHFLIIACTGVCAPSSGSYSSQKQLPDPSSWIASSGDREAVTWSEKRKGVRPASFGREASRVFILGLDPSRKPVRILRLRYPSGLDASSYGRYVPHRVAGATFLEKFLSKGVRVRDPPANLDIIWTLSDARSPKPEKSLYKALKGAVSTHALHTGFRVDHGTLREGNGTISDRHLLWSFFAWKAPWRGSFRAIFTDYRVFYPSHGHFYKNKVDASLDVEIGEGAEYPIIRHNTVAFSYNCALSLGLATENGRGQGCLEKQGRYFFYLPNAT